MPPLWPAEAVIINFRTPDLTGRAVASLRGFYPDLPLLLVDNGSGAADVAALRRLAASSGPTEVVAHPANLHHGPAMDRALRTRTREFMLFLDSDCVVRAGGFVERMLEALAADPPAYAAGRKIFMNRRGFDTPEGPGAIPYIRPLCMMVRRAPYLTLPPFERHGAPCLANMAAAARLGLPLAHVPVEQYVDHAGRGTAARHGYRLGVRGRWNHMLNRLGL